MLFFGAFAMRYRFELILTLPLVAMVMTAYLHLAFQPDSAAQQPEKLYRQRGLMAALAVCAGAMVLLSFVDVPWVQELFPPTVSLWQ